MNKRILSAIIAVGLFAPFSFHASGYYDQPLSSLNGVTTDDIMNEGDVGIYNSADFDTVILQTPSDISRTSGRNLTKKSSNYEMVDTTSYNPKSPDIYVFEDAAIDSNGNVYDLQMTINSVTELPGANHPKVTVHPNARITHEDVDINITLCVVDESGAAINRPLSMIYEDMDMMTELSFDIDQIEKVYAPYTDQKSNEVTNPASFFDYDTLSNSLIEEGMNANASDKMRHERLRYFIDGNKLSVYDGWNSMHKFDSTKHPEFFDLVNTRGFNNVDYLQVTSTIYNLQNTPEQNFSVVFNTNPITIDISQNAAAFGNQDLEANNLYLASPDFLAAPVDPVQAKTNIEKSAKPMSGDEILSVGEQVKYTISVTNPDSKYDAHNVVVRDSMLENVPSYMSYNNDLVVAPDSVKYSGNMSDGNFTIQTVKPKQTVKLTYSMTLQSLPPVNEIANIVTDTSQDPDSCDPKLSGIDCDNAVVEIEENGETVINKEVVDENENNKAEPFEVLTYTINVQNTSEHPAYNVHVRDSMLEEVPSYLSYNNDFKLDPSNTKYNGDLTNGNFVINKIKPGEKVKITYSMTVNYVPDELDNITNLARDDGKEPLSCSETDKLKNCDMASIEVKHPIINVVRPEDKEEITDQITNTATTKSEVELPQKEKVNKVVDTPNYELATTGARVTMLAIAACLLGITLIALRLILNRIK